MHFYVFLLVRLDGNVPVKLRIMSDRHPTVLASQERWVILSPGLPHEAATERSRILSYLMGVPNDE